ncbi:MAG TPA: hypothetical protein VHC96_05165 [Puia sp.]|nr:hypothetical protein [Puia sp.]
MSKDQKKDLLVFLQSFDEDLQELALWLREWVWDLYPHANELIYDNYNALAFGWSPTDRQGHIFGSVALYRGGNVHFGFYWGAELADPEKLLLGAGNQYRYILVQNKRDFPKAYIKKLLKEAYANSLGKVKDPRQLMEGTTIVKLVSAKKRAPLPKKAHPSSGHRAYQNRTVRSFRTKHN